MARRLELSRQTVVTWRGRYRSVGLAGLEDRPRSGRRDQFGMRGEDYLTSVVGQCPEGD
ncbi:helix-turn-helix domain-containing protein [Streptomyces adonidis]|uniref:helix-turn-helix domain-containing protein n=1 Tax=Streptomyces adonidis TaxID=3231367 RepID=UPI0034DB0F36